MLKSSRLAFTALGSLGVCGTCLYSLRAQTSDIAVNEGGANSDVVALTTYIGAARKAIHSLKVGGCQGAAPLFGQMLATRLVACSEVMSKPTVVTWVPASINGRLHRGFDQSQLLANEVAKCLGVRCVKLINRGYGRHARRRQTMATATERRTVEKFALINGQFELVENSTQILLIDDVSTTGSSLRQCRRLLGPDRTISAVIASAFNVHSKK